MCQLLLKFFVLLCILWLLIKSRVSPDFLCQKGDLNKLWSVTDVTGIEASCQIN